MSMFPIEARNDIKHWLAKAPPGTTHMLVIRDDFNLYHFPYYVHAHDGVEYLVKEYAGKQLSQIEEIYNLALPFDVQLREERPWHVKETA